MPYVIEPAAGATRTTFAFLIDAYHEEEVRGDTRVVLKLDPRLAPIKVGGAAALEEAGADRGLRTDRRRICVRCGRSSTTSPRRSAAATGARTRSARPTASPSTSTRSRTSRSRCAIATRWSRTASRSTRSRATCRSGSRTPARSQASVASSMKMLRISGSTLARTPLMVTVS